MKEPRSALGVNIFHKVKAVGRNTKVIGMGRVIRDIVGGNGGVSDKRGGNKGGKSPADPQVQGSLNETKIHA